MCGEYMISIILAAGKGTRVGSLKGEQSKCMLLVNGKSLLQRKVEQISSIPQMQRIIIVVDEKEHEIQRIIGNEYEDIVIEYVVQKHISEGVMDAVYSALEEKHLYQEDILIALGDEYFQSFDLKGLAERYQEKRTIYDVIIPTQELDKIKKNYSVTFDDAMNIVSADEKPEQCVNHYIGTGFVLAPGTYLQELKKEYYVENYDNGELVDIINYASHFGYCVQPYILETEYYNLNTKEELYALCRNAVSYDESCFVIEHFKKYVGMYENRIALQLGMEKISFRELDIESDKIAYNINNMLGSKDNCIGVLCGRTIEHIIAVLGILKSGNYFLPLDEHLPDERLSYMVHKAQVPFVIGQKKYAEKMEKEVKILDFSQAAESDVPKNFSCNQDYKKTDKAYVIFTSGSTGKPKGVIISQSSLYNLVMGMKTEVLDKLDRLCLQIGVMASFAFDLSVQQVFPSLMLGHTLHIIPHEFKFEPEKLIDCLNELDVCDGTPLIMDMLNRYLDEHPQKKLTLRHYLLAGDTLRKHIIHNFFQHCPDIRVTNSYGPTECTVETTLFHMTRYDEEKYESIPIGYPIGNTRVYVLSDQGTLLGTEKEGEIWIAGEGVALGYMNDPELTESVFCKDILCDSGKMYKTGDIGYYSKEGALCYIGRKDTQIKFKGYRIELDEIEKAMEKLKHIQICKVILEKNTNEEKFAEDKLIAYFTKEDKEEVTLFSIINALKQKLPEYMIPQVFVPVERFEITNNGKLNKEALPDYKTNALGRISALNVERNTENSEELEKMFSVIEKITGYRINGNESLMELGIDSIRLFKLIDKLQKVFKVKYQIRRFNLAMTVKEMFQSVMEQKTADSQNKMDTSGNVSNRRKRRNEAERLLPLQQYLADIEFSGELMSKYKCVNQMIYFIPLCKMIDMGKLNAAYRNIQMNNDCFSMAFGKRGKYVRVGIESREPKDIIYSQQTIDLDKKMLSIDLDEELVGSVVNLFDEIGLQNNILYELVCCKGKQNPVLVLSVHHNIFDYLSLIYFLDSLEAYYYSNTQVEKTERDEEYSYYSYIKKYNQNSDSRTQTHIYWDYISRTVKPASIGQIHDGLQKLCKQKNYDSDREKNIVIKKIPFSSNEQHKMVGYRLPDALYFSLKEFCRRYQLTEYGVLLATFNRIMQNCLEEKNPAVLYYVSGRTNCNKLDIMGFFSFMLCFPGIEESEIMDFITYVKAVEKMLQKVMSKDIEFSISNDYISSGVVFDYQKLYHSTINHEPLWSSILPFETVGFSNPFAFRIFDYGSYAEISIHFQEINLDSKYFKQLVMEFADKLSLNCKSKDNS